MHPLSRNGWCRPLTDDTYRVWILIPARAGSKGIPGKNHRLLGGKPLIRHVLDNLGGAPADAIFVSTDSEVIETLTAGDAELIRRPSKFASDGATLDEVAVHALSEIEARYGSNPRDILITIQPTSPFIDADEVASVIESLQMSDSLVSVTSDRHLRWRRGDDGVPSPLFAARVNRQWLPDDYTETGGLIACRTAGLQKHGTRLHGDIELLTLTGAKAIDIDTYEDWARAEFHLSQMSVGIYALAGKTLGLGHVYRAMAIAAELSEHDVTLVTNDMGADVVGGHTISHRIRVRQVTSDRDAVSSFERLRPDLLFVDVLDTSVDQMERLASTSRFTTTIEDLGPGSQAADLVINDLYGADGTNPASWCGPGVSLLSPEFEFTEPVEFKPEVERLLLTFGGTDPSGLAVKTLEALDLRPFKLPTTLVIGPHSDAVVDPAEFPELKLEVLKSVKSMATLLSQHDLVVTSGGRTVTEAMSLGLPTVSLCQNERELLHSHASMAHGCLNLGLGSSHSTEAIRSHIDLVITSHTLRAEMHKRALAATAGRSNGGIITRVVTRFKQKTEVTV